MKCIIYAANLIHRAGIVHRVPDEEAHKAVDAGLARYVPKNMWKKQQRRNRAD